MLQELPKKEYAKLLPLIISKNELSVFSVIDDITSGSVYVNNLDNPTAALIQTSECNLVAGITTDADFNDSVGEKIDFWAPITPDTKQWNDIIPQIHPDKFIRRYTRRHYVLEIADKNNMTFALPNGYFLESVNLEELKQKKYKNANEILDWIENWKDYEIFLKYGVGSYIRNEDTIVSWSISDCAHNDKIAIGIHTDDGYRRKGFAKTVVNEVIRLCELKGYKHIEWLCVDFNQGSIAVAEKMGFKLENKYDCFTPYVPVENMSDFAEAEWTDWAEYFEKGAKSEPRLIEECIYTYIKANNPKKTNELLLNYKSTVSSEYIKQFEDSINKFIDYLQSIGMASAFSSD
ncbi:MAG TPA: GNAT family N-acetyltransferase [Clostridia bacterium]|nr:GNAT family N-acetyltransferase [Clostridia bacterium]